MAVVMNDERIAATRALMAQLREIKSRGSRAKEPATLAAGRPVVLALEHELFVEVAQRMHAYDPPVILAVYYPASQKLVLADVAPAARDADTITVGKDATVGMVLDAQQSLQVPETWETIRLSQLVGC
jgi:hypothetical protein